MPEVSFKSLVTVHGQNQLTGWANDAPGALDESAAKGLNLAGSTTARRVLPSCHGREG